MARVGHDGESKACTMILDWHEFSSIAAAPKIKAQQKPT
jgi:hypothetical protein